MLYKRFSFMRSFCQFFFFINFTLETCMHFAGGDASLFAVTMEGERWKSCCECKRDDAKIGKNVFGFQVKCRHLWGLRETSLKFYCQSLSVTWLHVTAKCKCKRQHVRSLFCRFGPGGARVYFHFRSNSMQLARG